MSWPAHLAPDPGAIAFLDDLRSQPRGRTGATVVRFMQAWRFEVEFEGEDGADAFIFHPFYPKLQMGARALGIVHSCVVETAIGLVDSLRVHLPTPVVTIKETDAP